MAILKKDDLLEVVAQAVNECGWNIIYLSRVHPFKIQIFNETESEKVKVIIYNLSHGGGRKRPENEYRIQVKEERLDVEPGFKTLILGYWDEMQVFAGFDLQKHIGTPGYSSSMQIKIEFLQKALLNGFSPCDKGNGEIAVAFRPDFFVEYVRNLQELHSFGSSSADFSVLQQVSDKPREINKEALEQLSSPRQTIVQSVSKKLRDNSFQRRVLTSYSFKCAICSLQLKLIDAAHIVPVSHERSTDETRNGVALCSIHHRAYDVGLVAFDSSYNVIHNEKKMDNLKKIGHDGGMAKFIRDLKPVLTVPPAVSDRPHIAYINLANKIRGW